MKIEKKIVKAENADEAALEAELRMLEAEEIELDKQIQALDEEEKVTENELQRLSGSKASLE